MIKKTLSIFFLLLIVGSLFAQTPFIRNFSSEEYKANTQNWAIVQDQRGVMYFANNDGVLEYDGTNWRLISTPMHVRSLSIDSMGVIYTGGDGDFGYLVSDSIGKSHYISIKDKIPLEHNDFKEVWQTNTLGSKMLFRTRYKLFILKNNRIDVLSSDSGFGKSFVVNNRFYIEKVGAGLCSLKNDSLCLLSCGENFHVKSVSSILPYENDDILITTRRQGTFIYSPNKSPHIWKPDGFGAVDDFTIKNKAYCGTILYNGHFAIGSIVGGIIVFDKKGKIQTHYNRQNGLQSNTSIYLFTDLNGQLWSALGGGISLIANNLPFLNYTDKNGLDGSIYSVQKFRNKLYVGTDNNLFIQKKDNNFERIEGTTGQNFVLQQANETLLLGNYPNGIFEINDNKALQSGGLKNLPSVVAIRLRKHPNNIIAQVRNKGLALLEYKNEKWVFKHFIKGSEKNARYLVEGNDNNFWLSYNRSLYQLRLNEKLDSVIFSQSYTDDKYRLPESYVRPYRLNNGEIIFSLKNGIYRYLTDKNYFELHPDFSMFPKGFSKFKQDAKGNIWFEEFLGDFSEKGVMRRMNGKYEITKTPFLKFTGNFMSNAYALYPYSDSLVYIGTNKSLLEYHPQQIVNYDIPFNTLIREIYVNDSLMYGGAANDSLSIIDNPVILKYRDNNLFFHYAATFYEESEKNLFSFRLVGSSHTTWSKWTSDHKKEYTNLHEGKYTFEVKSKNIYRKYGNKASFSFEICPPWQRTWWAYTLYGILAMVVVYIIIQIYSERLKRHNELLKKTVSERTADILNQKEKVQMQAKELKEKNEKLNLVNSTKDKFFAIISHDLRSPFNSILGFADLLVENYDDFDDFQKREIILSLSKSSQSAFELLENLLSWSRTQRGQIKINKESLNLNELVETSINPYKYSATKKDIDIAINVPPELKISIDRNTLTSVIGNLVNNAIKFTPDGGNITISYIENDANIELHIIDTGVGMTSEVIGKLFRIDENISTKGTNDEKGTGLGLILCKEFIQKNGGEISVRSEVGKGSDFIITFSK